MPATDPAWQNKRSAVSATFLTHPTLFTPQVVVVSEPAVVKEILHRRDLDKSAIVYAPVAKVLSSLP